MDMEDIRRFEELDKKIDDGIATEDEMLLFYLAYY